jgi:hypothetical protein
MKVAEPIIIDGQEGDVSYFDDNLKQVPKAKATVAKVRFKDSCIAFFFITPGGR